MVIGPELHSTTHIPAIVCLMLLAGAAVGSAQDWPQFRGRNGGVAADDPSLPDTWNEVQNVAWKLDIPGRGWSSPVVSGDHVFVTAAINVRQPKQVLLSPEVYRGASTGGTMSRRDLVRDTDEFRWVLYDVDATSGRVRWERVMHTGIPTRPVHMKNSYASETPVTDGQARLCVSRVCRPFRLRHEWHVGVGEADGRKEHRQ